MAMRDTTEPRPERESPPARPSPLNPRTFSPVPPPPMVVVRKGWWGDRETERPAEELAREAKARRG